MRVLTGPGFAEVAVKRSRFLASAAPVPDEEAARAFLAAVRARHPDARHHPYAYRLWLPSGQSADRMSDDGEPAGTGGQPILVALRRAGVTNAAVVVSRLFGGVLLGTGGLTRAYGAAAAAALRAAQVAEMARWSRLRVHLDYSHLSAMQQAVEAAGGQVEERAFSDRVAVSVLVPPERAGALAARVRELTAGTGQVDTAGEGWVLLRPKEGPGRNG